jgi:hypothetical protein
MIAQPHPWREAERNPHPRTRYAYGFDGSAKRRPFRVSRLPPEGSRERSLDGSSWLEPPASRCCTALHTGNACWIGAIIPGLAGVRLACSRRNHNPDKSPTPDNHNTSAPVRERPTTSRSVRCASHDTSPPRARRRSHAQACDATVAPPPWNAPPCPPPPCAAWTRSGWQRTAAPSNAAVNAHHISPCALYKFLPNFTRAGSPHTYIP